MPADADVQAVGRSGGGRESDSAEGGGGEQSECDLAKHASLHGSDALAPSGCDVHVSRSMRDVFRRLVYNRVSAVLQDGVVARN